MIAQQILTEILGSLAACLVFVSYLFENQVKLRVANILASVLFVIYGFFLAALSGWVNGWVTIVLNLGCTIVHIVWLIKHRNRHHVQKRSLTEKFVNDKEK